MYRLLIVAPILLSAGCAGFKDFLPEPVGGPLDIVSAGLLATRGGSPELGVTLHNATDRTLWVNVHFRTPNGDSDCVSGKELVAGTQGVFLCPQPELRPDTAYPIRIAAFEGPQDRVPLLERQTELRFGRDDVRAAGGQPSP